MPVWDSWGLNMIGPKPQPGPFLEPPAGATATPVPRYTGPAIGGLNLSQIQQIAAQPKEPFATIQGLSQLAGLQPFGDRAGVQRGTVVGAAPMAAPTSAGLTAPAAPTATDLRLPRPITNGPQRALAHMRPLTPQGTPAGLPADWFDPRMAALQAAAGRIPAMTTEPNLSELAAIAPRARMPRASREELEAARMERRQALAPERQPREPHDVGIPRKDQETRTPIGLGPVVNGTATYSPAQLAAIQQQTQNMALADRNRWLETAQAIMGGRLTGDAAIQAIQQLTGTDRESAAAIVKGLPAVADVIVGMPGEAVSYQGGPGDVGFAVGGAGLAGLPGASGSPQLEWAPDWTHYMQPSLGR